MSDREPLTPELKAVEAALASLVPTSPSAAARDQLMFTAGRDASHRRASWTQVASTLMIVAVSVLYGRWSVRPVAPSPAVQIARPFVGPADGAATASEHVDPSAYGQLRRRLRTFDVAGIDAAPRSSSPDGQPSYQHLLRELLN
jgi:hypothetical protein